MKKHYSLLFLLGFVILVANRVNASCSNVVPLFTTSQTNICGPGSQTISFINTSTGANTGTSTYKWFLNGVAFDNTTGMVAPAASTISAVGAYIYKLVVTDPTGPCKDSTTITVNIYPTPSADFTFINNQCAELSVNFTNTSLGTTAATTFLWNFGDSLTATTANPNHTFLAGGTYNVTLTQTNGPGCTSSKMQVFTAKDIPNISISGADADGDLRNCLLPGDPTTSEMVTFSNTTTNGVSYVWDFGDGTGPVTTNSLAALPHTYTARGTYTVTMTATHANGCTATTSTTVIFENFVAAAIALAFNNYGGCAPYTINTLTNSSVNASSYTWNFGDGTPTITTSSDFPPIHTYTIAGLYTISLTAANSCNSSNVTINPITITTGPNANFTNSIADLGNLGCVPQNVAFTNTSTGASPANNYQWNMGNGNVYSNVINPPIQTYATTGVYTITLIAKNTCGSDTTTTNLTIDSIPLVDIVSTPTDGCSPLIVSTANNSSGAAITYTWTVDSVFAGNSFNLPNQTFINANSFAPVNHTIQLVGTNHCGSNSDIETITVHPTTTANFSTNAGSVCAGGNITFTDASFGEGLNWEWDFGVSTANNQGPHVIQYNVAGTYPIKLIVDGYCGPDTIIDSIIVLPVPIAAFTTSADSVCLGSNILFTNNSTLGSIYNWTFGGGIPTTSNAYTPVPVLFNAVGNQTITLTVGIPGCTNSDSKIITIQPKPSPAFTLSTASGCSPLQVAFNYTGAAVGGDTYNWILGDGTTSTSQNPQNEIYTANAHDSTYTVKLIVTNAAGCIDSSQSMITVHPKPLANYTTSFDTACAGVLILFSNTSIGATTYSWTFADGTNSVADNPSHVYNITGNDTTQLVATTFFGCKDTIAKIITVNPKPVASFIATTACHTYPNLFTDASTNAVSWAWNFGDATPIVTSQSPNHTYANSGTYSVGLLVHNAFGCTDSSIQFVVALVQPKAHFTYNIACAGQSVQMTNISTYNPTIFKWDFGDASPLDTAQNPTHVFSPGGTYNVKFTVGNSIGCVDSIITPVIVHTVPVPDFRADTVCLFNITSFRDLTTDSVPIATWLYDFSDGNQSISSNPSYIFQNSGTYNVRLTVTNINGCTNSIVHPVLVTNIPVANFMADTVCIGSPTMFTDSSTGLPSTWFWNFGDGNSSAVGPTVQHTYASSGIYMASLFVSGGSGCSDQIFKRVEIKNSTQAGITVIDSICDGNNVNFTDHSTITSGTIDIYFWDFGDGLTSNTPNASHLYAGPGTFTVTHTVGSLGGCSSSKIINVTINNRPIPLFVATTTCQNGVTSFNDSSTIGNGTITKWFWNLGDGSTSTQQNPTHTYTTSGNFMVTLTATSSFNCTANTSIPIIVYPAPAANFSVPIACPQDTIQYTDLSTINSGTISSWLWDFTDGTFSSAQNPEHKFVIPTDTAHVKLIVTSNFGCTDTVIKLVKTQPVPDFHWAPDITSGCEGLIVHFTDTTTVQNGIITNWAWDFDDGSLSFSKNPTHVFDTAGNYYVSLWVTASNGCHFSDSVNYPIIVYPAPIGDFTPYFTEVSINTPEVQFTDLSTGAVNWEWYFGDGKYSNDINPTHEFLDTGLINVRQIVYSNFGCADTTIHSVHIFGEFSFFIPNAFTPANNDSKNATWRGYAVACKTYHLMVFDRWGKIVFETTDPADAWDGTYKGVMVPEDVYVWKVVLSDSRLGEHEFRGRVTVLQ